MQRVWRSRLIQVPVLFVDHGIQIEVYGKALIHRTKRGKDSLSYRSIQDENKSLTFFFLSIVVIDDEMNSDGFLIDNSEILSRKEKNKYSFSVIDVQMK